MVRSLPAPATQRRGATACPRCAGVGHLLSGWGPRWIELRSLSAIPYATIRERFVAAVINGVDRTRGPTRQLCS
jgi:hypothetical protein